MPASVVIKDDLIEILWSGVFEVGDVYDSLNTVKNNLNSGDSVSILIKDQIEVFHFDASEARLIAQLLETMQKRGVKKTCIVVNKPVHYGIGRMISAYCEMASVHFDTFWQESDALAWLHEKESTSV